MLMARQWLIAPIFIPHEGCPYRCVFCNQKEISGSKRHADRENVERELNTYLKGIPLNRLPKHREVAFYGGSFTGLPADRQEYLLSLVQPWIDEGFIHSIRLSTHPLFIDENRLALLKKYRVKTIELGIQSTDPEVLRVSRRECRMETIRNAVDLIRKNGFALGLQLMSGLPMDNEKTFQKSVDDAVNFRPDFVRLYPALVIRHTQLEKMYRRKQYVPWELDRTLEALKLAVIRFKGAGIRVIRLGLHSDPSMLENYIDGPFHPAMRYLVESRICLDEMARKLKSSKGSFSTPQFRVPQRLVSNYIGHKRENVRKLMKEFCLDDVTIQGVKNLDRLQLVGLELT